MGRIKCCYKCTKRKIGCHSVCKEYTNEKEKFDEANRLIREEKEKYYGIYGNHIYNGPTVRRDKK